MEIQTTLFGDDDNDSNAGVVNVASVPQRSPFRYPGGKTWFVPRLREWLKSLPSRPKLLIEPFAGGGIISLTTVFENLADAALMVELDEAIAAVWETVIEGEADWLATKIRTFEMTKENAIKELERPAKSYKELAFKTIIKNRTYHGGILAAGSGFIKNGESGKGILSRWYPATLARRFREIDLVRHRLKFKHADAFKILAQYRENADAVYFIDPPYTAGGKKAGSRLYRHYAIDHDRLFSLCSNLRGDFIMTYDNASEVHDLALKYGFMAKPIAMKNTHHAEMTELVIGKNLDWMEGVDRAPDNKTNYSSDKS